MSLDLQTRVWRTIKVVIGITPWLLSMYVFYWLNSSGTWTSETPHRGKLSVALLAGGMLVTFLLLSRFDRRQPA